MMNDNVLPKGTVLHNGKRKYIVEEVLGAGGFGITYKVSSTIVVDNVPINTFFAMKEYFLSSCYRDNDSTTMLYSPTMRMEVEQSLNDFITEAKRLNLLGQKSNNIVKVNEVFKENGTAYYIMEYLEGGNLQEYVRRKGALSEAEAIALITPIAHAVEALHSERILHLDIKPGNIVLKKDLSTGKSRPVLIDFGLVKHFDSNGKPTTRLAAKGASDGFAPMEQYTTIDSFEPTLDVYALGATLYYLLKGKNPPKAFDIESSAVIKDALPATVSENTRNAIACAMEKSKFKRTPAVSAFLSALSDGGSVIVEEPAIEIKMKAKTNTTRLKDKEAVGLDKKKVIIGIVAAIVICAIQGFAIMMCGLVFWEIYNDSELQTVDVYGNNEFGGDSAYWDDTIDGHEYVDLGLPSGLKWATCNVGASSPSDYGDYFAWGETTPKSEYTAENCKTWEKNLGDISGNPQYDAACANWGDSWRLPSETECMELKDNCTWTWTSLDGYNGYEVTGPNGNSIFLPAAGWRDGSSLCNAGDDGSYWSSTPSESDTQGACDLDFNSSGHDVGWYRRYYGFSVRLVSD